MTKGTPNRGDAAAHQGRDDLRRRGPGPVPDANGRAAVVAEGSKDCLLQRGAGSLKEEPQMNELKGNFKAAYDVVKRAERCVLLRSKAANPSHTYAVGDVDSNGLVFGLVLKTDLAAAVREFRTRSFPSWSPWNTPKA